MIDRSLIGRQSPPILVEVEKGAIRRFADAIGDSNPLYHDEAAAQAAGYSSLVAPPTFAAGLWTQTGLKSALAVSEQRLLVGEEQIEHTRPIVAGDRLTVRARVADIQERTGPAGGVFTVILEAEGQDPAGAPVYRARQLLIVRRGRE